MEQSRNFGAEEYNFIEKWKKKHEDSLWDLMKYHPVNQYIGIQEGKEREERQKDYLRK